MRDKRLASFLDGKIRVGPENVHIDLTKRCQLNCVTCWDYSAYVAKKKKEKMDIDLGLVLRTIRALHEMKVERIILSGGEPFLYPEVMDVISEVKGLGMKITIITNGLAIREEFQAQKLLDLGVDTILMNVSSASAETYVRYHPNQKLDAFDKLLATLKILKHMKDLKMVQVINRVNCHEIKEMIELAKSYEAELQFKLASIPHGAEAFALGEEKQRLQSEMTSYQLKASAIGARSNLDAFALQVAGKDHEFPIELIGCYAGYFYSRIDVTGKVFFCCKSLEVGDLQKQSFAEIWQSDREQGYRELLKKSFLPQCRSCGNWTLNFKVKNKLESFKTARNAS